MHPAEIRGLKRVAFAPFMLYSFQVASEQQACK